MRNTNYREITPPALILGIMLGIIMTMAFVYAGLKLGFTLGGSTVAAIVGFVALKGIFRKGTIVENNINQTIASGINTASAGIIFTLPALLLMGETFSPWPMLIGAVGGSFLGITLIIPLRKQLIEIERLRFPSGTATAAILQSGGAGRQKAILLGIGFLISFITVFLIKNRIIPDEIPLSAWLHLPGYTQTAIWISLMNIGAGLLSGIGGLPFALGGILAYWFIAPIAVNAGWTGSLTGSNLGDFIYGEMLRPLGIGLLIGGALAGVIVAFPAMKSAFKSLKAAANIKLGKNLVKNDLSINFLYTGGIASMVILFLSSYLSSDVGIHIALIIAIVGTVWIGVAGLIVAQCTGMTDISPISGLALIAVTIMLGITSGNVVVAVLLGVAVCVAIGQCADMMQDLKTGHLVGSIPRKQQIVQYAVAWIGPVVAIVTVYLLWTTKSGAPGFGPNSTACVNNLASCISAPQAGALQGMINGILRGDAPIEKYLTGAILGGSLSLLPISGLGVLVGLAMYLPFPITLGYGLGCVISIIIKRVKSPSFVENKIVPLAAGFIVGEALTELAYSLIAIVTS
jgi:putative OPT family oligopeptide transporter